MGEFAQTVYRELHALARQRLAAQRPGHTLQPTALLNEAWLKLRGHFNMAEPSPAFFKTAAEAMRNILIDHARARQSLKRGAGVRREAIGVSEAGTDEEGPDLEFDEILLLHQAVARMETLDPQAAEVVKLRFFAGLSVEETAAALGVSERTVKRDWSFARAWLAKELSAAS